MSLRAWCCYTAKEIREMDFEEYLVVTRGRFGAIVRGLLGSQVRS